MPSVDTVLCHSRLFGLFETCVCHMLFTSSLIVSPSLSYIYFTAFTRNLVHAQDVQTQVLKETIEI
jgi:hypothetical protein